MLRIVKCPRGHQVVTSKKKDIQCHQCSDIGVGARFDA